MIAEITELTKKNTQIVIDLPENKTPINGRWVYKIKTDENNKITKYKARWVIKEYSQILGIDYLETFATTCRPESYRLIFILALQNNWTVLQYDVKNAFPHANIDTEIYIELPTGFEQYNKNNKKLYGKLQKALYGLKQSPRLQYQFLKTVLNKRSFTVILYDKGIFINKTLGLILICYVNNILLTGPNSRNKKIVKTLFTLLLKDIELQDLGEVSTYLGINITINYKEKTIEFS